MREASDIVEVIGECVQLRPRGREFVGLCPFHDDHKPSMCVVPSKQIFHCFSCGTGGDVFSFVQRFHGMEFCEALEFLAQRAGIELERVPRERSEDGFRRRELLNAVAMARDFYRLMLRREDIGCAAREAIAARGISEEMVERFELGCAPDRADGLLVTARRKGLSEALLREARLVRRDGGRDLFRHRLIFPIHDQVGRVIAFGARRLREDDEPKYLNSPESRIFDKSATLYGLAQASRSIQRERAVIVTEGYTDVIACHQAGFTNCVATLGTALTARHAQILRRLCDTIVLLFDSDEAGMRAADRAAEVLFSQPVDVRVASLGDEGGAKDPDEVLRSPGGVEAFRRAIDRSTDLLVFRYERLRERLRGAGIAAQQRALEEEVRRLGELGLGRVEPTRRQFVVRRLSEIMGLPGHVIGAVLRRAPVRVRGEEDRVDRAAVDLHDPLVLALGCVLGDPSLDVSRVGGADAYAHPLMREIARGVERLVSEGAEVSLRAVLGRIENPEASSLAVRIERQVEAMCGDDREARRRLFEDCLGVATRRRTAVENDDPIARIRRVQAIHRSLGGNPSALPRAGGGGGAS